MQKQGFQTVKNGSEHPYNQEDENWVYQIPSFMKLVVLPRTEWEGMIVLRLQKLVTLAA